MSFNFTIERASILDHTEILQLLIKWFDESPVKDIPKTCNYTAIWLSDLIANHLVLVGKYAGRVVGTIGMRLTHFPWNNEVKILSDDFLMVAEEYRSHRVADLLISEVLSFARNKGLQVFMGHFSGKKADLKDRYLETKGFKYLGGHFLYKGE